VADQVRSDRCGVSQSGEPPFLTAVAAVDGAQSVAEPGIRSMPSTTYFWMTALDPSADLVTTQVWRASIPSHLLLASGGFQTLACQLTMSLTSAWLPRGTMSSCFMVWTSSKKVRV